MNCKENDLVMVVRTEGADGNTVPTEMLGITAKVLVTNGIFWETEAPVTFECQNHYRVNYDGHIVHLRPHDTMTIRSLPDSVLQPIRGQRKELLATTDEPIAEHA